MSANKRRILCLGFIQKLFIEPLSQLARTFCLQPNLTAVSLTLTLLILLTSCTTAAPIPTRVPAAVLLPPPPAALATAVPPTIVPFPTPQPRISVGAKSDVPVELVTYAQQLVTAHPNQFEWKAGDVDIWLTTGDSTALAEWIYVIAAPFATLTDNITQSELITMWQTNQPAPLIISDGDYAALTALLGEQDIRSQISLDGALINSLWAELPSFTIRPFHQLVPQLKALQLDGISSFDPAMAVKAYPLTLSIGVAGDATAVATFLAAWDGPTSNRDPHKITSVAMTGVTALVRATAHQMELSGVSYPGTAVSPILTAADITHVSNEVAFAPDCPYPDPIGGTTFCSRDSYFALLQEIGVDVVELTGNHLNDWGTENLLHTLDLYENEGWQTFGGGRTMADAAAPAIFTHNGNQIAFVGCNPVGPTYAWVSDNRAGSQPCNDSFLAQISTLRDAGYLVIATQQYHEFYHYAPTAQQQLDFKALADAGATAVSGSQGHHAQGFDFHNDAFIHYGLGNLFFDQMDRLGTRQTFVDTYTIYDGRLLGVTLWTGLIENYARPREMTAAEREQALTAVFQASGW
ncbi:MAG: CapA family protein [Chloroflexi bacterium]|nr:CapA family protein [Chloroflexota bacterium]